MKNKKGMTLIEVMIAMLVLSIAMIGGISFFMSAYRINYSYMESANRIDHALRYVEKLKVQRRNYPTYGAFPNMGGSGFTVFFVDSEPGDEYASDLYYYEDYVAGTKQIPIAFAIGTGLGPGSGNAGDINPNYYYFDTALSSPVAKTFRFTKLNDLYPVDTSIETVYGSMERYFKFQLINANSADYNYTAYYTLNFTDMASYLRNNYTSVSANPFSKSFDLNYGNLYYNTTSGGAQKKSAYAYYNSYGLSAATYKKLYTDTSSESGNPEFAQWGTEGWEFDSFRGYSLTKGTTGSSVPTGWYNGLNISNHLTTEVYRSTDTNQVAAATELWNLYASNSPKSEDVFGSTEYKVPPRGAYLLAEVQHGKATGNERIVAYKQWTGVVEQSSTPVVNTVGSSYLTYGTIRGITVNTDMNSHRLSKYRRSVYVSIYPVESMARAEEIINKVRFTASNLNARITIMENEASARGYKMIKIPFILLYANNSSSTLCEDL